MKNKHIESIELYLLLCQVRVKYIPDLISGGVYSPSARTILIDENLNVKQKMFTLLHEAGHFIDYSTNPKSFTNASHNIARRKIEKSQKLSLAQKRAIIRNETKAWKYAKGLARQLKIPLGKNFEKDRKESLKTYRQLESED